MFGHAWRLFLAAGLLAVSASVASAAPPASCARKFIGTWVYSGGTTVVAAGGIAYPKCPMCVATQSWTCQGNTYLFSNSGPPGQFSATLSADGRQLISGSIVATRIGGAPRGSPATAAPEKKEDTGEKKEAAGPQKRTRVGSAEPQDAKKQSRPAPSQPPSASNTPPRRSASCSDITGTSSTAPAATHCKDADRALYAARQVRQSNPKIAEAEYKKAAAAARRAGDNSLELSILREAIEPLAAAVAAVAPQEPATAISSAPVASSVPRMWDGTQDTCRTANNLEQGTAGWYVMCVEPELPKRPDSGHRPNPDPLDLQKQARQACGSYSRDTQQCFADFKLKVILQQNPNMRDACEKHAAERGRLRQEMLRRLGSTDRNARERFLGCVDNAYLYGNPDGPASSSRTVRESLKRMLNPVERGDPTRPPTDSKPGLCWSPGRCCPPGHGLKPTPGGFGASSCQPLGLLALNTAPPRLAPNAGSDTIEDFEDRVNDAAANAVAAALEALGPAMSETNRDLCASASFAVVHAVAKGGAPNVPEQCRAIASAARGYFAIFANGSADNSNSAMDELLASFRGDLGAPLPGMIGLTPDERMRRTGECMLRGGTAESCN